MSSRTRNRRLRAMAEMEGQLNVSETERVYKKDLYNDRQSGYYGYSRDAPRRHDNGNSADIHYQYKAKGTNSKTEPVTYSSDENSVSGRRKLSYRKTRMYSRRGDLHERTTGDSGYYRTYYDNGDGYYVRGQETIKEEPETEIKATEPEEVLLCCGGKVEIVDSTTCKGMKVFRCYNSEEEIEEETEQLVDKTTTLHNQSESDGRLRQYDDEHMTRYRNSRNTYGNERIGQDEQTESDSDSEYDYGYAEIPTRALERDKLVSTHERPRSSGVYHRERLTRNAAIMSRPRSASSYEQQYRTTERIIQTAAPQQRHVGIQMNTRYVLPSPPKKLVRNVNTQTIPIPQEKPPPRQPSKPPRRPKYIGEIPRIEHYKTAVINIKEKEDKDHVVVIPTEPKKIVIEAPKPVPEPEIEWIYEYKPDPDVIMEPIYDPLPTERLPLPVKEESEKDIIVQSVEPATKTNSRATSKKHKRNGKTVPPLHLNSPGSKDSTERSHKVVFRVFAKGSTALFHVHPAPKGKSIMVRVGGGWMKVEHHRYNHYPLAITEHNRCANKDKFLYIKSKFTTNKKNVPVAYKKYREEVVKPGQRDTIAKQG